MIKTKVTLTNLDKIYWPKERYAKSDVIDYYDRVAEYLLPYLKDRPESLNRHPDGINGENFFQKNLPVHPNWVKTIPIYSKSVNKTVHWLICNDRDTLLYMANLGCIELNPWNSRYFKKVHPDYLILDLDPEDIGFDKVVETAQEIHKLLQEIKAVGFLKTSGKRGLHILVPLGAKYTYKQAAQFAQILAQNINQRLPEITSIIRDPKKRQKKVYVDFLQNRMGQTLTPPYSLRPVPQAPVSTPLRWEELKPSLNPTDFNIKSIFKRLSKVGDIWQGFLSHPGIDVLKALDSLSSA